MKIEHRALLSWLLTVGLSQKAAVLWKARDILLPSRIGGPERGQATLALLASEYLADDRPNRPDLLRRARLRPMEELARTICAIKTATQAKAHAIQAGFGAEVLPPIYLTPLTITMPMRCTPAFDWVFSSTKLLLSRASQLARR